MANEDAVLKEVDQELAEERQWAMFRKYGPAAIGGATAVILGVGAMQFWSARENAVAQSRALEFKNATELLAENESQGRQALEAIAEQGGGGYGVLSQFQRGDSFARAGEAEAAIAAFRRIYDDGAAPKRLRDLARLRAAYLALGDGRDAVLAHLGDLSAAAGPYGHHANEVIGLAALDAGDYETALATFRSLSGAVGAPEGVRNRAQEFAALAAAGKAGVNISGRVRLGDVLEAVGDDAAGEAGDDEPAPPDAAGIEEVAGTSKAGAAEDAVKLGEEDSRTPSEDEEIE